EGPSMVKNSPARISRSMPATAITPPYFLVRPARRMSDEEPSIPRSYPSGTTFAGQIGRGALAGTEYSTHRAFLRGHGEPSADGPQRLKRALSSRVGGGRRSRRCRAVLRAS